LNIATVRAHDLVTDREAEAGAIGTGREERLEDPRQIIGVDAATVILDLDPDPAIGGTRSHGDLGAGLRRIGGVVDEVREDLAQALRVALHGR